MFKQLRILSTWLLAGGLITPSIIGRTHRFTPAPTMGVMQVHVTYNEEASITDDTKNNNGAQEADVSSFRFRATAEFEQLVMMQPIAGAGVNFYPVENTTQMFSGAISYNGEIKRTALDEEQRPSLEEKSVISFAGVLSDDSASSVPNDNAAGIQFGIQSDLPGGCQGKRTYYTYAGKEKKTQTAELNSCRVSDELHAPVMVVRVPLNLDLRQKADGKEFVHYASQFQVTSCNLRPQYCTELKAAEAAANSSGGPNSEAMSDNWIGATTTGSIAAGFQISLILMKELKVPGAWKRYLQMGVSVRPESKRRAALERKPSEVIETADRLRGLLI